MLLLVTASAARGDIDESVKKAEAERIAAIAKANGCTLATRNVKDFATTGLQLIDPWRSAA